MAFRFDLARYRAEVVVPGAEAPRTAADLRQQHGAVLAVNGGFFDERGRPLGLRISRGRTLKGLRPVDWGVLVLSRGRGAHRAHARVRQPRRGQDCPGCFAGGPARADRRAGSGAAAAAFAPDRGGRGRRRPQPDRGPRDRSMSAETMGQLLQGLGFRDALLLDGGPSTQLSFALGQQRLEYPGGYPVPDGLLVRAR